MSEHAPFRDEVRKELIGGKEIDIVPRSFVDHGLIAMEIAILFNNHLDGKDREAVYRVDFNVSENDILIPDVVICDPALLRQDGLHGAPELVVEVLTPGSIRYDRGCKMELYQHYGVKEVWLVDFLGMSKTVEQYFLEDGRYRLHEVYVKHPDKILDRLSEEERAALPTRLQCSLYDDFEISVDEIFGTMLFP